MEGGREVFSLTTAHKKALGQEGLWLFGKEKTKQNTERDRLRGKEREREREKSEL